MKTVFVQKRTIVGDQQFHGGKQVVSDDVAVELVKVGAVIMGDSGSMPSPSPQETIAPDHYGRASVVSHKKPVKPEGKTEDK